MATTATVARVGDIIRWEIPVLNLGPQPDTNVVVTGAYPTGVTYKTATVPAGTTWNSATPQWTIPNLAVNETKTLIVYSEVTDISQAPFVWTLTVDGDNADATPANDTLVLTVTATTAPPTAGAIADTTPHVGDVSTNDTPCSHCTTEYREDVASVSNLAINNFNTATGKFDVTLLDPTSPGTFEYTIWCTSCPDGSDYETSGPVTVTIPAFFSVPPSDSLVDNGDGTYTHTDVAGNAVTFNAGWTTITKELDDSFTFDYPDGTSVNHNFLSVENVTTLVDNADGTYTYTNESAADVTFNVPEFSFKEKESVTGLTSGTDVIATNTLPADNELINVYRNGLLQVYTVDYTRVGQTLTFSAFGASTGGVGSEVVVIDSFR